MIQLRCLFVVCCVLTPQWLGAVQPTELELARARQWVAAKFAGRAAPLPVGPGLVVLANHDPVQLNARGGAPMRIGQRQFTRGLYCHADSEVVVRLPAPGKTLSAITGVDSNNQTRPGRGSVVFLVRVGQREAYRGELMREGDPAVPIEVDLNGAQEFVLTVSDGGDGISCDQADWADAKVVLADGSTLRLGELPLVDATRRPPSTAPPFSFTYGGRPFAQLRETWRVERSSRQLDAQRIEHVLTYTDPVTGLVVRCEAVAYVDFPTVEWTLSLHNAGPRDTPILTDIRSLDVQFARPSSSEFVLHHHRGSPCLATDYEPFATPLPPELVKQISAAGGRPTNGDLPYFNVAGGGEGVIVVVGWPGQWEAQFARDAANTLHVQAGQQQTHFVLHPGEQVRTPLSVLQFWQGDRLRSQNVWRRWMLAHNLPRPGGELPPVQMAACSSHQFGEMIHADSASQKLFIDRYLEEDLPLDYWWMDAGWYINRTGWPDVGTWEIDTNRFPGGLRPICDHAHRRGVKTIVWFEPERVTAGTWLAENHPEWILGGAAGGLLDLGNPQARSWLTEHVDKLIVGQGIDLYRQDFNMDPLAYWRAADAKDRQGITEIRHVEGYLAYWDELRRRHPTMLIDSCASGGRRNDLETLRRSVPLLRSDYIMEPIGNQCHTYGIASWMPYHGTGTGSGEINAYLLRSVLCPHFTACFDVRRDDLPYDLIRRVLGQWQRFAPYYLGDYYPLTEYSLGRDVWMAWQFDCPERGEGVVQAFRRDDCIYESARLRLHGLQADGRYIVSDLDADADGTVEMSGQELMDRGLLVTIADRPGSAVVVYEPVR